MADFGLYAYCKKALFEPKAENTPLQPAPQPSTKPGAGGALAKFRKRAEPVVEATPSSSSTSSAAGAPFNPPQPSAAKCLGEKLLAYEMRIVCPMSDYYNIVVLNNIL